MRNIIPSLEMLYVYGECGSGDEEMKTGVYETGILVLFVITEQTVTGLTKCQQKQTGLGSIYAEEQEQVLVEENGSN